MPPSRQPRLGSAAVESPLPSHVVRVTPATCHDLSLFKEILKEYRKLDDTIVMRLNRASATMRDRSRVNIDSYHNAASVQDEACAYLWQELVVNWKRRMQLINYCAAIVSETLNERQASQQKVEQDPVLRRKMEAAIFAEEVKRNQVQDELSVEAVVRGRSVTAFRSRCQFFTPSSDDAEAREMWDLASRF